MIYNLLIEGKRQIENAVRWQGLDLKVVVNIKKIELSPAEKDIEKLKEIFGNNLIVKGGNDGLQ